MTLDSEQCDDPLRPIMRVNFTENMWSLRRKKRNCPLYTGVRIKRVSTLYNGDLSLEDES